MHFIEEKILNYSIEHTEKESPLLKKIREYTQENTALPQMLSGPLISSMLKLFTYLTNAKIIFDIGTFTGYSAVSFAEASDDDTIIHTFDKDEYILSIAEKFFREGGHHNKIKTHCGEILQVLPEVVESVPYVDLAFIDADKANYKQIFEIIFTKLRKGGIIIVDNVLWSGKVLEEPPPGPLPAGIKQLNNYVKNLENIHRVFLPVRDGNYIVYKL